jgi:hypothetical protein
MAVQIERIGDVEEGAPLPPSERDELGLTAEERAIFDGMRDGDADIPADPEPEPAPEPDPAALAPDGTTPPAPAPAPEPTPEDDDTPDTVVTDPKTGKKQSTISFGKHQRLLTKAQQAAEQARQLAEQERINNAKLAERLAILNEALTAPPPPTPEERAAMQQREIAANPMLEETIDPAADAIGALAQIQRRQDWLANTTAQQQEATREVLDDQQMISDYQRDTTAFSRTEAGKHFFGADGAYQFLKNSRLVDLAISLFDKDPTDPDAQFTPQEVQKLISDFNAEERWVVSNAQKAGKSPAAAIMKLARGRGWKPPQAGAAPAPAPAPAPTAPRAAAPAQRTQAAPAAPAVPAARAPGQLDAVAQLQAEAAAAAASRSLSDGGGAPPGQPLTMERLVKMNDAEFAAYIDNLPKDRLDAIMGKDFPGANY